MSYVLVAEQRTAVSVPSGLGDGGQPVRLAEEAAASAVLGSFALMVRHGVQASANPACVRRVPLRVPLTYG